MTQNNLLGKCTRGPKIGVLIANKQRISTSKPFSPTNVTLGAKIFTGLSLTVLPHLKCVDLIIFGLPPIKELNMSIQPSNDLVLIGDTPFQYDLQPRRVSCLLDDSSKIRKIKQKIARNKHIESEFSLVSFHFLEELEPIKTDFGPE